MNLYELIANLTAAIEANTAAIQGKAGTAASTSSTTAATTTTAGKGKKVTTKGPTREEVNAKVNEVKEALGATEAKALIAKTGAAKLADVPEIKLADLFKLATDALSADDTTSGDDDDGI